MSRHFANVDERTHLVDLFEYQARDVFEKHGVPVLGGIVATTPAEARAAAEPPPPPRVVVIAQGDSALSLPAQQRIEDHLSGAGHRLLDAETVPGLSGGETAALIRAARRHARVVVIVRAEPIGSRDLNYYGRHDVAYTAYLSVRAYDTQTGQPISSAFRQKVEFAALNAEQRAHEALDPELSSLARAVAPALRQTSRG